jgi:signal transduction histidine kinase
MNPEKVLVVDDNVDNADLLAEHLQSVGYEVQVAHDGVEALEKVDSFHPDLVVLDVVMPRMDGFEVCRRLKTNPATNSIPVILLTAKSDVPDKEKGLDIGADDYMTKPFNPRELAARVRMLIRRRQGEAKRVVREKMGALGLMAEGVAHEVRNPMVAIGGFARRIHMALPPTDPLREYTTHIIQEVERLENMVNAIVSFKTLIAEPRAPVNLVDVANWAIEGKKAQLEKGNVKATVEAGPGETIIFGDGKNLKLALEALIENSIEAMEDGGEVKIQIDPSQKDKILINVSDNGRGIAPNDLDHVFDPFFTSKMSGAGMGLTMVHRIVGHHQGEVYIRSEQGKGTVVTIELPRGMTCEI